MGSQSIEFKALISSCKWRGQRPNKCIGIWLMIQNCSSTNDATVTKWSAEFKSEQDSVGDEVLRTH